MSTLVMSCSDGRLNDSLLRLQSRLHIEDAHRMMIPGGPLVFTLAGAERRMALDCVNTLVEANGVKQILLLSHQDCRSYERRLGGLGFDQQEILTRDLRRAKDLIENEFPNVEVYCYFIPWREDGNGGASFGEAERVE